MAIDGKITRTDDDAITGWIASLTFDVDITLTKNPHKSKEPHPDFEITTRTPRNRIIRIDGERPAGPRECPAHRGRPRRRIPPGPTGCLSQARGGPGRPRPRTKSSGQKSLYASHGKLRRLPSGRRLFPRTNTQNMQG